VIEEIFCGKVFLPSPRFQPMITIGEYTKLFLTIINGLGLIRNADSRVFPRVDASDYSSLDVEEPAVVLHTRHFCCRGHGYSDHRHFEHVPLCRPDGRSLRHQYRSGLAGEFST
jgi:hypothetical protein